MLNWNRIKAAIKNEATRRSETLIETVGTSQVPVWGNSIVDAKLWEMILDFQEGTTINFLIREPERMMVRQKRGSMIETFSYTGLVAYFKLSSQSRMFAIEAGKPKIELCTCFWCDNVFLRSRMRADKCGYKHLVTTRKNTL